jgi:hypothetical protein
MVKKSPEARVVPVTQDKPPKLRSLAWCLLDASVCGAIVQVLPNILRVSRFLLARSEYAFLKELAYGFS